MQTYSKYRMLRRSIESPEQFIDSMSSTPLGKPYYVVSGSGRKQLLSQWLHEKLSAYQKSP